MPHYLQNTLQRKTTSILHRHPARPFRLTINSHQMWGRACKTLILLFLNNNLQENIKTFLQTITTLQENLHSSTFSAIGSLFTNMKLMRSNVFSMKRCYSTILNFSPQLTVFNQKYNNHRPSSKRLVNVPHA